MKKCAKVPKRFCPLVVALHFFLFLSPPGDGALSESRHLKHPEHPEHFQNSLSLSVRLGTPLFSEVVPERADQPPCKP